MALPELKSFVPKKLAIPTLWQLTGICVISYRLIDYQLSFLM